MPYHYAAHQAAEPETRCNVGEPSCTSHFSFSFEPSNRVIDATKPAFTSIVLYGGAHGTTRQREDLTKFLIHAPEDLMCRRR